ncbi:restriction endonuclease subunit S [Atopobium sp. oral taxon 199]|uniref:restriction endonuclease subunit S n=1 Tax=Atopobium sp. oral taxon 199 TaxID=712156 RepID=UPI00034E4C52|nr:restriction endonuclease subunit S [Atopobium sp. oral taxon 199]EPD78528.1 type I restriction enzyme, S subunit [Atopobium sp. oral taxon 199 str. F0494]
MTWEQRKLGELGEFNPKEQIPNTFEYVDLESVVGTVMIGHRRENRSTAPSRAQRLAKYGDIFYQTVRPYQKNNYLYKLPDSDYVFSTGYAQIRPVVDSTFLYCLMQQDSFVSEVLGRCTGTSYPAINVNDLADIEVSMPVICDEQRMIGRSISNLDNLITLHLREPSL